MKSDPLEGFPLDSKDVSTFTPTATVIIRTGDHYAPVRGTRADESFIVEITSDGLRKGADDPFSSKRVMGSSSRAVLRAQSLPAGH